MQLVRMLGRNRIQQQQGARLEVGNRRVELDQTVVIDLRIDDASLAERSLPKIDVAVEHDDAKVNGKGLEMIQLLPIEGASGGRYRALWRAADAGRYKLSVVEPALDLLGLSQGIEVVHPADELRQPAPDHERLEMLAGQTGGEVLAVDELEKLTELVPNRARRTPNDITEPLWDSLLALLLVLILLTVEWVGRKVMRLV